MSKTPISHFRKPILGATTASSKSFSLAPVIRVGRRNKQQRCSIYTGESPLRNFGKRILRIAKRKNAKDDLHFG